MEAVIEAHARLLREAGYGVSVLAGRGEKGALPAGTQFVLIPEMDSQHPLILASGVALEQGKVPDNFDDLARQLADSLHPALSQVDAVIVHNVFTKHFNLPLTAALHRLLDRGTIRHCVAWCHDFTWTSPSSRSKVHPGFPWDLLRTYRPDLTFVAVSQERQHTLARLLQRPVDDVHVVYNGVHGGDLLGLSPAGRQLVDRLGLLDSDLALIMPVRVTQAKNIEYALHVTAALKRTGCRVRLVVTGPPDPHDEQSMAYYRQLQALRRRLDAEQEMRFVFESGPNPNEPFLIDSDVVAELLRSSDIMFMPSHREGFGMPVLEAGLLGIPVVSTAVPAAMEIGGEDVVIFDVAADPAGTAGQLLQLAQDRPAVRLRRRVRRHFTWQAIFRRDIEPLLA